MGPNIQKWCARCVEAMAGVALWMAVLASGMDATTVADEAGQPDGAWNEPGSVLTEDMTYGELVTDDLLPVPLPVE